MAHHDCFVPVSGDGVAALPAPGENALVHGDNLAVLRALASSFAGQVRCAYLDPPYNTGAQWEHYGDKFASEMWQNFMKERLVALLPLMSSDGIIVIQIDDREHAYLQFVLDSLLGRDARICTIVVKMSELSGLKMSHAEHRPPKLKEYLLVYGVRPGLGLRPLRVLKTGEKLDRYLKYYTRIVTNPEAPVEKWHIRPIREVMAEHGLPDTDEARYAFQLENRRWVVYRTNNRLLASMSFDTPIAQVTSPTGISYIWWEGKQMLFLSDHVEEAIGDLWTDISTINLGREGGVAFRNGKKPESLLRRVLEMASDPGDLVLDPFAGSGTTAAVAHKMGRRWLTIEAGPQAWSHVAARLTKVVAGEDPGGITQEVGWTGGGSFQSFSFGTAAD